MINDADEWCLSKAGASWPVGLVRVKAEAYEPFLFELPVHFECYMLHTYMQ